MMDGQNNSQNNTWTEWANYVLHIIKKHDGNFDEIEKELRTKDIAIENKLDKEVFTLFRADDYNVFKTEVLTKAKYNSILYGAIVGGVVSFIFSLLSKLI